MNRYKNLLQALEAAQKQKEAQLAQPAPVQTAPVLVTAAQSEAETARREQERLALGQQLLDDVMSQPNDGQKRSVLGSPENQLRMALASGRARLPQVEETEEQPPVSFATLAQEAQQEYDDYINSEEHRAYINSYTHRSVLDAALAGLRFEEMPILPEQVEDPKERELAAKLAWLRAQEQAENNQAVMEADMAELATWPEEDIQRLRAYAGMDQNSFWDLFSTAGSSYKTASEITRETGIQQGYQELIRKYGEETVKRMRESLSWYDNQQNAQNAEELAKEFQPSAGGIASGFTVARAMNLYGSITSPLGMLHNLRNSGTGRYMGVDPNSMGNLPNVLGSELDQRDVENIAAMTVDKDGNPTALGTVLGTLYQAGASAADSLLRVAAGGGSKLISRALIAGGSLGRSFYDYASQGQDTDAALLMATFDAGLELLTEEASLERIIHQAEYAPAGLKDWMKNMFISGGIEVSEEELNFLGTTILQATVFGDRSAYNQQIGQLVAEGMAYEEAKAVADKNLLMEGAQTAIQSFLSGGMMSGVAQVGSANNARRLGKDLGREGITEAQVSELMGAALQAEEGSPVRDVAQQMQGKKLTSYDRGRLYQAALQEEGGSFADIVSRQLQQGMQENPGAQQTEQAAKTAEPAQTAETGTASTEQTQEAKVEPLNNRARTITAREQVAMARLSRFTGRQVVYFTEARTETGVRNGIYKDGKIYINTEGKPPLLQTFSHEMTHSIEKAKGYGEFAQFAKAALTRRGADLAAMRKDIQEIYAENGVVLTDAEADREIVADFAAEYLFTDERSILRLAQENRSVAVRIRDWFDRVLAALGNENAQERVFLQDARNLYAKALEQSRPSAPAADAKAPAAPVAETAEGETRRENTAERSAETAQEDDWDTMIDGLREDLAAGRITEEQYDEQMDYIEQQRDLEEASPVSFSFSRTEREETALRNAATEVLQEDAEEIPAGEILTEGAVVTDGDGTRYSISSMRHDIAEGKMFEDLKKHCGWNQKQVDELRQNLEELVEYMVPHRNTLDMNETYGREGRRFSPYKPNSDKLYKISLDFSTLCSKRLLTQYVIENLQEKENRPMSAEEQMAIRDMLIEYRKQEKGLQVACAMCYVEAARLKSPGQIQKWLADPAPLLQDYFAKNNPEAKAAVKKAQEDFKEARGYPRNAPKKNMSRADKNALDKIGPALRAQYQPSEEELAIIERAKALPNSTYLSAGNLANLSENEPEIYRAYTSFVRSATRSKGLETDEPYYYGDSLRDNGNGVVVTDSFIEAVGRENGMRFSSWSDWRIQHLLDYITAVIDLSVRGAAMHGYTKFPEEVRVLGKTGMMFNLSGVAGTQTGLNPDGTLSFSETESINKDEAVQLREEFPETAGLQCIGVSDEHIRALLASDIIDYVIPYHISGLNKALRTMANIQGWRDYTGTQNATVDKRAKLENAGDPQHWHEEPVFSEFFVGYDTGMSGIEAMRASADRYLQMCADRGLTPKFEKFSREENYWKLLIDRKMINQQTGQLIRQKPVSPIFDFEAIKGVVDRHVDNYDSNMEAKALQHVLENWDTLPDRIRQLKKNGGGRKKNAGIKAVEAMANEMLAAQQAGTQRAAEAGQYSISRVTEEEAREIASLKMLERDTEDARLAEDMRTAYADTGATLEDMESINAELAEEAPAPEVQSARETMPRHAAEELMKAERTLQNKLAKVLNIPFYADRGFLQPIIQQATDIFMQAGTLHDATIDLLFFKAYDAAAAENARFHESTRPIMDYLRSVTITVSDEYKNDSKLGDLRKQGRGVVRIKVKSERTSYKNQKSEGNEADVNAVYQHLSSQNPELFPAKITNPGNQLKRICDVAKSLRISEQKEKLRQNDGDDEARRWSRGEFQEAVSASMEDLRGLKKTVDEWRAKEEEKRQAREEAEQKAAREAPKTPETPKKTAETWKEYSRETMPAKARPVLERAERSLRNELGKKLQVAFYANRDYLMTIIREMSDMYLRDGAIHEVTMGMLFDKAYAGGVARNAEFYAASKPVQEFIQGTALVISKGDLEADQAQALQEKGKGVVKIVVKTAEELESVREEGKPGRMAVDTAYAALAELNPELFPDSKTHPADQLERICDVANSIWTAERSVQGNTGPRQEEFRRWARADFEDAVGNIKEQWRTVKRYAMEQAEKAIAEENPSTIEEVTEAWKKLKDARRAYERANAKHLLTTADRMALGRLLRGEIQPEDLNKELNVSGIVQVYEAKKEYDGYAKMIGRFKEHLRGQLRKEADSYLRDAIKWKDKKTGAAYSRETMRRNIQDIVPDKGLAKEINRVYFESVHHSEAEATRFKNAMRERVRAMGLSTKVPKGEVVSESHAVQLYGEAMDNIIMIRGSVGRIKTRDGKTEREWQTVIEELFKQNPSLDRARIEKCVEEFRKIYDELFQRMNDVRIRNGYEPVNYRKGYFPHFQPGDGENMLLQFGKALGIDTTVQALPTTINGMTHTFKPGIQWFGHAQERLGFNTGYDALMGFDKYIEGVSNVIFHTENIQRLRALEAQIRYRTSDKGIRKQVDEVNDDSRLSDDEKKMKIEEIYKHGKFTLSNFVDELSEYTNLLAGKKSRLDRTVEAIMGRRIYTIMKNFESRVGANMVGANLSSALTNFIPLTQASAQLDRGMILKGMWDTLKAYKEEDGFWARSDFLTNRRGSDPVVRSWVEQASKVLSTPMELIDGFVSDSIVRAAYAQNVKRGMSEQSAMEEADIFAANVMADRSKGALPTLFESRNPVLKAFTQFQVEGNNQWSEIFKDLPRAHREKGMKALAAVLFRYFLGAFLYNEVYEFFMGRRPAMDPIGILNDTVGDWTGYELPNLMRAGVDAITGEEVSLQTERVGFGKAMGNMAAEVAGQLPFSAGLTLFGVELDGGRIPASSAIPDFSALWQAATEEGWSAEKRWYEIQQELNKLAYVLPPFGGAQISKAWKGIKAFIEGGSYSVNSSGEDILQYPIFREEDGFAALVQAALLGKNSLPQAQEWVESGFDSLNARQTAVYQDMINAGTGEREAYELIRQLEAVVKTEEQSQAELQRELLLESEAGPEAVAAAYYGLLASEKDRTLMDTMADQGADQGELARTLMSMQNAEDTNGERQALLDAFLTEEEKLQIYRQKISDSKEDEIAQTLASGLSFDDFLRIQIAKKDIDDQWRKSADRTREFTAWVDGQNFTDRQVAVIADCFGNYAGIESTADSATPASTSREYNDLVGAGLSEEKAQPLAEQLDSLTPVAGEDSVDDLQRYRVIVESGLSEEEQMVALEATIGGGLYQRAELCYANGVSPAQYLRFREILPSFDSNGSGTISQDELKAALDSMGDTGDDNPLLLLIGAAQAEGLTNAQRAVIWQSYNKSWKPSRNPYDRDIGQRVWAALNGESVAQTQAPAEGGEFSDELLRQLLKTLH